MLHRSESLAEFLSLNEEFVHNKCNFPLRLTRSVLALAIGSIPFRIKALSRLMRIKSPSLGGLGLFSFVLASFMCLIAYLVWLVSISHHTWLRSEV